MMALLRTPRQQYTVLILLLLYCAHGTNGLQGANILSLKNFYVKGILCSSRKTRSFDDDARGAKHDMDDSSFEKKSHMKTNFPSTAIATTLLMFSVISYPMASGATPPPQGIFADRPPTLSQSSGFANLPRERPLTRAIRERNDLKDLEDYRLDVCAERGVYWEQCFMYGEGTTGQAKTKQTMINNGLDYQLISPLGALDPGISKKNMPPTW
jgi:hypothetical protein